VYLVWPILPYNIAGWSVAAAARRFGVSAARVTVVHDDLDKAVGELRWKHSGSAGGNKGVRSVAASLHTDAFRRLRVGIGRPPAREDQNRANIVAWVLGTLPDDDWEQIRAGWAEDTVQATLLQSPGPVDVQNGDAAEAP
jgi:peptidyl-tRNA hydrolase